MVEIGLTHFLVVSALLAAAGIASMLIKRNALGILMGVELLLNAAGINFVAFNHYGFPGVMQEAAGGGTAFAHQLDGIAFAIFIIVLAAAEAAVALAIILNYYHRYSSVDVDRAGTLKG